MSFFSFQDIICSITGVMILLTIVLALELVSRVHAAAEGGVLAANDVERLGAELRVLKQERANLEQDRETRRREMDRLVSAGRISEDDLHRLQGQIELLRAQNRKSADELARMRALRNSLKRDRERATSQEQERRKEVADAEARLNKLRTTPLVGFIGKQRDKLPLLVECADGRIIVGEKQKDDTVNELASFGGLLMLNRFIAWARGRDPHAEYFVLLVWPDGVDLYETMRANLSDIGFDLGWNPWAAEKGTLFPQRK